jgi:outer membrane lipoprotein SlyB
MTPPRAEHRFHDGRRHRHNVEPPHGAHSRRNSVLSIKKSLLALALATLIASCATVTPYAPQQYDFSELVSLPRMGYGIVESVHEAQLDGPYKGVFAAFKHAIKPETIDRLVIRLDDGRAVTLLHEETDRFEPGQRVRVVVATDGAHLERE